VTRVPVDREEIDMLRPAPHLALFLLIISLLGCERATEAGLAEPGAKGPSGAPIELPIEVLGPAGSELSVLFHLDGDRLSSAAGEGLSLSLLLHNVVEVDSCELSVNGGEGVDLGSDTLPFLRARGEVARGAVAIAGSSLEEGENRLTFRYTRQIPNVSGFRIVEIALSPATAADGLPEIPLRLAEAPPSVDLRSDAATLERGARFFKEVSRDGGPVCAGCHTANGEDLQYFAFSSVSIVERAMFHEFSREEAEDIASYIRALDVPALGRVFAPPFQPGAGAQGSAGAGLAAIATSDAAFSSSLSDVPLFEAAPAWGWASEIDTFRLETPVQLPTWFRWLPRELRPDWFTANDGALSKAEKALADDPTVENAQAFSTIAVNLGKDIWISQHDWQQRVDLMRFAAMRLWDFSRKQGFDEPHHGFPAGTPAYPYEIGFAFFEALQEGTQIREGAAQVYQWWWLQLVVDPGRGLSDGRRPLNYEDVQIAADLAAAGPAQRGFIHLLGSWEESRGAMATNFGTEMGPVRLLGLMMTTSPPLQREMTLRRFFAEESRFLDNGGVLTSNHRGILSNAWAAGCAGLSSSSVEALRAAAPAEIAADLDACP
jgi:hypothetical protein